MKIKWNLYNRAAGLLLIAGMLCVLTVEMTSAQTNPERVRSEVFIDQADKQNITGQTEIAFAWGELLDPPQNLIRGVINLKEAMNRWTEITTNINEHVLLSNPYIMNMPFIFVSTNRVFDLTETERKNLRAYFDNGGFMFLDNSQPVSDFSASGASLQKLLKDVIPNVRFAPVPNSHEIYHSFFDFDDGPPRGAELGLIPTRDPTMYVRSKERYFLEGAWRNDELVAVYSDKGYIVKWNDTSNNEPQLRMGVNLIVYALTKWDSIAKRSYR